MISQVKKRKLNPVLTSVLMISGGAHVLAIVILGGITVVRYYLPEETQFEEPPEVQEELPPPEVSVDVKPPPRPMDNLQNLRMRPVSQMAVAAVDIDLPDSSDGAFTVSAGLGSFRGGVNLGGGASGRIRLNMDAQKFFGMNTRAERIFFLVNAGKQMVTDDEGGLDSYKVVKQEIIDVIRSLATGTLFNVAFYDGPWANSVDMFRPKTVPVTETNISELSEWMAPINVDADTAGMPNDRIDNPPVERSPRSDIQEAVNRRRTGVYLIQMLLEQNVDAVFVVSNQPLKLERVIRDPTPEEEAQWQAFSSTQEYQEQLALFQEEEERLRRTIQNRLRTLNEQRRKNGQPPKVLASNRPHTQAQELGIKTEFEHPGYKPNYDYDERVVDQYIEEVVDVIYENAGGKPPEVNLILLAAKDEEFSERDEEAMENFVDRFDGDYRILRGLAEIKDASVSGEAQASN